jgi:hypothetical protein
VSVGDRVDPQRSLRPSTTAVPPSCDSLSTRTSRSGESVLQLAAPAEYFGGVPREVLFDSTKAVIVKRDVYGPGRHRWHAGIKRAMFLSAFAELRDTISRAYHARKISQGKRHNQALIALARRRCDVLFAMLRDGTLYSPPTPTILLTTS